jgi:hypothetical protein
MQKIKFYSKAFTVLIAFLFYSCVKDTIVIDDISTNVNRNYKFDIPGGTIRTTLKDLLQQTELDTIIKEDKNGLLYLSYQSDLAVHWPEVIPLEDQSDNISYDIASFLVPESKLKSSTGNGIIIENTEKIILNNDEGVKLDSMILKNGNMNISISLPDGVVDSVIISIPQLFLNNMAYTDTMKVTSLNSSFSINLQDAIIQFIDDAETPSGFLELNSKIILLENPSNSSPSPANINYTITDLAPDVAFGNFGQRIIQEKDVELDFSLFKEMNFGTDVQFFDFSVDIEAESNFGAPYEVAISDIKFSDTETMQEKTVDFTNNIINIDGAIYVKSTEENASEIENAYATVSINKDNSNIQDILDFGTFTPDNVSSHIKVTINPNDANASNFLTNNSQVISNVHMKIPLWVSTSKYTRLDTIAFDYNAEFEGTQEDDSGLSENLQKGTAYFDFINGLPFDLTLQAYFTNENYMIIDSLIEYPTDQDYIIQSAKTDPDTDKVVEGTPSTFSLTIENEDLTKWKNNNVKYIIIKTAGKTDSDNDYVQISSSNFLDITTSISIEGTPGITE